MLCSCLPVVSTHGSETVPYEGREISFLLSPDGRYLGYGIPAYDHDGEEITRLMICKLDGTQQRQVQKVSGHSGEILWLGNDRVIYSARNSLRYAVISLDGAPLADIVLPAGCDILYKRISPNGRRVAFVGRFQSSGGINQTGLFVVELMTGQVRCLIDKALKTAPAWSPDSRRLAIGNSPGYVRYYPLVIVDVETGEISATEVEGVGASWSSDGRFLAFTTEVVRGGSWLYGIPKDGRIGVLDVGTKELIHVTPSGQHVRDEETGKQNLEGSLEPVWSPDGQRIAYRTNGYFRANKKTERKTTEETWIVDKEGQGARKVADGFGPVAWSHDSQSLFILKENQIDRVIFRTFKRQETGDWSLKTAITN